MEKLEEKNSSSFRIRKNSIAIGVVLLVLVALPLVLLSLQNKQIIRQEAATIVRGTSGDLWADIVLGQPDFAQEVPGEIVPFKTAGPGGVTVDRSVRPNRVYVFDGMNSRILGYSSLGSCSNDQARSCTTDSDCSSGASCSIKVGGKTGTKQADLVLGQTGFNTSACNGDGTNLSYPDKAPASASSLCSLPANTFSPYEYGSFSSMVTDAVGNLYVADPFNNRILKYNSPFTTDRIADEVWGQDNFTDTMPNKGRANPDATTLSLINSSLKQTLTIGIGLDSSGNLWVTDPGNNRVLRYPKTTSGISKTADLVLGQTDFTSVSQGTSLAKFYNPSAVAAHPDGRIFVADTENDRVIEFTPPFSNGEAGTLFEFEFRSPNSITFEPNPAGLPGQVGVWIHDSRNSQLIMFDNYEMPVKVLEKDGYNNDGVCTYICEARGSIGITSDGDIISAASTNAQNAFFFKHPIPLNLQTRYPAYATFFSPPDGHNFLSNKGFMSARGLALTGSQVVVADAQRLLYWNTPRGILDLSDGKAADGVAGVANFETYADPHFSRIDSDTKNNLWVARGATLEHYSLPLSFGEMPDIVLQTRNFRFLNSNAAIGKDLGITDIAADPAGRFLWLAIAGKDRVIRVKVPSTLSNSFYIDAIIGGDTLPDYEHNWGDTCQATAIGYPNTLCFPGSVTMDNSGNLYISNTSLEFFGDHKLMLFDSSRFPVDTTSVLVLRPADASKTYSDTPVWKPAFSSDNKMTAGFAAMTGSPYQGRAGMFTSSLSTSGFLNPDALLQDWFGQGYSAKFDGANNLYVTDLNWGRVLIYKNPFSVASTPVPSATTVPQPTTTTVPGSTNLNLTVLLHGLGNSGDNVNPNGSGNMNPVHPNRSMSVEVYNANNVKVAAANAALVYNSGDGKFHGVVNIGTVSNGTYMLRVGTSQYLWKRLSTIWQLTSGQTTTVSEFALTTGDTDGDNKLSILDYGMISDCYSDLLPAKNCADTAKKQMTDITDDDNVNQFDYNLYLRELSSSVQSGM